MQSFKSLSAMHHAELHICMQQPWVRVCRVSSGASTALISGVWSWGRSWLPKYAQQSMPAVPRTGASLLQMASTTPQQSCSTGNLALLCLMLQGLHFTLVMSCLGNQGVMIYYHPVASGRKVVWTCSIVLFIYRVQQLAKQDGFARRYLQGKAQLLYPEPRDVFPCELIDSEVCRPPTSYL